MTKIITKIKTKMIKIEEMITKMITEMITVEERMTKMLTKNEFDNVNDKIIILLFFSLWLYEYLITLNTIKEITFSKACKVSWWDMSLVLWYTLMHLLSVLAKVPLILKPRRLLVLLVTELQPARKS